MKCPVQMQRVNRQKCLVKMLTYFKCNPVRYPISICFHWKKGTNTKFCLVTITPTPNTHTHKKESKNLFVICDSADKLICLCCVVETQTDPENISKYAASLSTTWTENRIPHPLICSGLSETTNYTVCQSTLLTTQGDLRHFEQQSCNEF